MVRRMVNGFLECGDCYFLVVGVSGRNLLEVVVAREIAQGWVPDHKCFPAVGFEFFGYGIVE